MRERDRERGRERGGRERGGREKKGGGREREKETDKQIHPCVGVKKGVCVHV